MFVPFNAIGLFLEKPAKVMSPGVVVACPGDEGYSAARFESADRSIRAVVSARGVDLVLSGLTSPDGSVRVTRNTQTGAFELVAQGGGSGEANPAVVIYRDPRIIMGFTLGRRTMVVATPRIIPPPAHPARNVLVLAVGETLKVGDTAEVIYTSLGQTGMDTAPLCLNIVSLVSRTLVFGEKRYTKDNGWFWIPCGCGVRLVCMDVPGQVFMAIPFMNNGTPPYIGT